MKGYRTLIVNAGIISFVTVLKYLTEIDWTEFMSPTAGVIGTSIVNLLLRIITNTKLGQKETISVPVPKD